ncbi:hypothetical protein ACIQPR_47345 [Streptomyces sp. NPDC091280]|uniref:hypothetical protein n=1 Tax=Streptomyces sp. NPDC091280 TaxID=3365984 RepID=UPI00380B0EB5
MVCRGRAKEHDSGIVDQDVQAPQLLAGFLDRLVPEFGLTGFTEALRQELLVERVRVGVVEPGAVQTELVHHLGEATRTAVLRQVSGIEPLQAADIADAIGYIVTRDRQVAVNEMLIRAGGQTW